jgi:type I restriction enzyme S subunit
MKDSGVEWLGEIPEHWNPAPIKIFVKFINGAAFKPADWSDEGVPIIRIENLNGGDEFNCYKGDMPQKYHVAKYDLLFGWSGNRGTSFGPYLWWREGLHYLNQHIFKLNDFKFDKQWLYWCLKGVTYYVEKQAHGIIGLVHITKGDLGAIKIPLINLPEQKSIVKLLDRETERIDTLIARKERQIELLQEKRSTLITQAVTKGLDPNVKMKDSGVEWLGEIPEHWEIKRLKYQLVEPLKYGANESSEYDDISWPRYVRITDINYNGTLKEDTFKSLPEEVAAPYLLKNGDLLLARSGATVGKSFIYKSSWGVAAYAGYLIRARLDERKMLASYASYFCKSTSYWTIQNVSAEKYDNLILPVPPIQEQTDIISFLDVGIDRIDNLLSTIHKSIELLREYRSALISAAVTGKIDVTKEVA